MINDSAAHRDMRSYGSKTGPELQAQYEFPTAGKTHIACKVQDDMGGEASDNWLR